ncbi:MAG: ribonuclease HI [Zetaproteobacteria bacterium]|nr:MAG: ribonuclease HI [Zetaproteobacteria bacterium]
MAHRLPRVEIYVDGACSGNPGPGGWAAILRWQGKEKVLTGGEARTTNQRMELTAAVAALSALKRPAEVHIYSDSQYLVRGMTEWLPNWKKRGWKNAAGEPVANRDLWEKLDELAHLHRVRWVWIRGHAGHPDNERADALARQSIPKR